MRKTKGASQMNQAEIGAFIAKCRKEQKMTQAQLAERLNITDRAVSKWETGKCMPDSSIMLELCEILGISVNELLSGKAISRTDYEKRADENLIALKKKDENSMAKNTMLSILFSITLFIGILVCLICNLAVSGRFTWAFIPVSSIVFAWLVAFPAIFLGTKGILGSLLSLSICIVPYLFLLSRFTKTKEVFSIGTVMAVISILFLWILAAVFHRTGKAKKSIAFGISFLAAVPFMFLINGALAKLIAEPLWDVWDLLTVFLLLFLSFFCFFFGFRKKK